MVIFSIEITDAGAVFGKLVEIALEFEQTVGQIVVTAAFTVIALDIAVAAYYHMVAGIVHLQHTVGRAIDGLAVIVCADTLQTVTAGNIQCTAVEVKCTVGLSIAAAYFYHTVVNADVAPLCHIAGNGQRMTAHIHIAVLCIAQERDRSA